MSKVALSGNASGTGTFTIASPNSNVDRTLNLPDASGTILTTATPGVPVNGPAFSAGKTNANQAISAGVWTKIQFNTKEFDTNNCFDNTTNYRFTPNVAGYYQVSACGYLQSGGATNAYISVYKNGVLYKYGQGSTTNELTAVRNAACIVYLNGSTDYVEIYAYTNVAGTVTSDATLTYFQAAMIRSAT